jgi:rhomboid family GlyGly-CTERM serine protease
MRALQRQATCCPLAISAVCLLIGLLPGSLASHLQYARSAVLAGEWWRLVTGHFVHLGWSHLLMNLAGLWLIWQLFLSRENPIPYCLYRLPILTIGTSLGLLLLSPEVAWYCGLSGMLHGLLTFALLQQLMRLPVSSSLFLALFAGKLAWEQLTGPLPGSEAWTGGRVIVDAHLYGTLCGVILWILERSFSFMKNHEVVG